MSFVIPAEIDTYLDRLLEETHGTALPEKLQADMKRDLYGRLQNHLLVSLIQALPNEHSDAFDALMITEPEQEEVQRFFSTHIPNTSEVVASAMLEFRDIYLGASKS